MNVEQPENLRHSCAHLLAAAVMRLWPHAKRTIGPSIENGFYFDFDFGDTKISEDDFPAIEAAMRDILPTWKGFERHELAADEAKQEYPGNTYKHELIDEFTKDGQKVSFYKSGDYWDLCRGGHVDHPDQELAHFKLLSVAGAYWRGSEKNPMLTRIYGTCFTTAEELEAYLVQCEEAKKHDHRKLGRELELFAIIDEVGAGLPLFYPKGATLRRVVENFIGDLQKKRGYQEIWVPHVTKGKLYEISGHLKKYDAMYPPMQLPDEDAYYLKPMSCPHFMMLYKSLPHSYRELPVRYVSTTTVYRYEKSGECSGLTRVRCITQDDCHVFTLPSQIEGEINLMLDMIGEVYKAFGFENFWVRISTHDPANKEKYIGDPKIWEESEAALAKLIEGRGWNHKIGVGEAAFYGPKLDFIVRDAIGREWQLSTIQLDMNLPERFELEYIDADGTKKRPVVIHRAILGSTERFLGILIEHYGGAFPLWLAPVQVQLATVSEDFVSAAKNLAGELRGVGVRVELDVSDEKVGKKIRNASLMKMPWTIVVGAKEADGGDLHVRVFGQEEEVVLPRKELIERLKKESQPPLS